jgi:hypothetical protein
LYEITEFCEHIISSPFCSPSYFPSSSLPIINLHVIELDLFDETNAMVDLINQQLGTKQDYSRSISISAEAIKSIFALTNGNSRNIIRYVREALKGPDCMIKSMLGKNGKEDTVEL